MISDLKFTIHPNRNEVTKCYKCRLIFVSGAVSYCDRDDHAIIYHRLLPIFIEFDDRILFYYEFFGNQFDNDDIQKFFHQQNFSRMNEYYKSQCTSTDEEFLEPIKYYNFEYQFDDYDSEDGDIEVIEENSSNDDKIDDQLIQHFCKKHKYCFMPYRVTEEDEEEEIQFLNLKKHIKSSNFIEHIQTFLVNNPQTSFIKQVNRYEEETQHVIFTSVCKMDVTFTIFHAYVSFLEDNE